MFRIRRRKAKTHKNVCESKRVDVKTYLAHKRFTYLVGMTGNYTLLNVRNVHNSLFHRGQEQDWCTSASAFYVLHRMLRCIGTKLPSLNNVHQLAGNKQVITPGLFMNASPL